MRVLLTGASGFLGSHLFKALLKSGYEVVILKRSSSDTWRIKSLLEQSKSYDVDKVAIELAFEENEIDAVIHTACDYGRSNSSISAVFETNFIFSLKLLEATVSSSASLFINTDTFFNSPRVAPNYMSAYTYSKKYFVEWLKKIDNRLSVANLKLHHVYGPDDGKTKFIPWYINEIINNVDHIDLSLGDQKKDFIYVDDVVSAYICCLEKIDKDNRFQEYDVCTGVQVSLKDMLVTLKSSVEKELERSNGPVLNFGARPYVDGEIMSVNCSNSGLKEMGWGPNYDIQSGCDLLAEIEVCSK